MVLLRPSRLALLRLRTHTQRHQRLQLLARAFSDAVDPLKHEASPVTPLKFAEKPARHVNGVNGGNGATAAMEPLEMLNGDQWNETRDLDFTAQRIGFPITESEYSDNGVTTAPDTSYGNVHSHEDIREESRAEATAKAERILAVMRHSMTELSIGKVVHRVAQYATLPRVTAISRKQFLRSLESRFGEQYAKEYQYMLAFLQGKDELIEQLEIDSRKGGVEASDGAKPDFVVPEIMGLHPDLVADPEFISIVFCYCRLACLNALKLVQRPGGSQHGRGGKSSLWQVKSDFRKVLDMEGYAHYADMLGLEKPAMEKGAGGSGDLDAVDAEWEEFNLENDRIDFRMLVAQTQELAALIKRELPNETISKMLVAMLASLKTSKLHRKIFQEMVCNLQTTFPDTFHEQVLSELVPFLSGNNATFSDFDSELATNALHHHQMRHEAILRALLETRMRVGHILIHDIDEVDPTQSVSTKLTPEQREKVVTAAWNIVSVLDDRKYHMFYTRFLKYKLAWRPNRTTFGETFLADARATLGVRHADAIMPLFEEVYQHLSVETLTICRVKLRHSRKLLRGRGALEPLNDAGRERLDSAWQAKRCVFYNNLPHGVPRHHLKAALQNLGEVKRFFLFSKPVDGPPPEDEWDEEEEEEEEDEGEEEEEEEETKSKAKKSEVGNRWRPKKHKECVIASDRKTPYQAVVEFESESMSQKALIRAHQIFGVMMAGWLEYRPVFSSPPERRTAISLMNVPYGTTVGELVDQVNQVLASAGLSLKVSGTVPRGVMLINGRMELQFPSFVEAAQVVELLHEHVRFMKPSRPLTGDDKRMQEVWEKKIMDPIDRDEKKQARDESIQARKDAKEAKKKAKDEKRERKAREKEEKRQAKEKDKIDRDRKKRGLAPLDDVAYYGEEEFDFEDEVDDEDEDEEDEDEDEDEEDEEDEDEEKGSAGKKREPPGTRNRMKISETQEEFFRERAEEYSSMTQEQRDLGKMPRPFDVVWNPLPRAKNKHLYL